MAPARKTKQPVVKAPPKTIDAYLARLPTDQRVALAKLRGTIKAAAPRATESISYHLPAFKLDGERLTYFAAAKAHYALYGMSSTVHRSVPELKPFEAAKGTLRFDRDKPLPLALVTKLVKARVAEIRRDQGPLG